MCDNFLIECVGFRSGLAEESSMSNDAGTFADWLSEVRKALDSINMPLDTWHAVWPFDFNREFANGTAPSVTALKANRFWCWKQNQGHMNPASLEHFTANDRCSSEQAISSSEVRVPLHAS